MRRRPYNPKFKKLVIAEGREIGNMAEAARQYDLNPQTVYRWARELNYGDLGQLNVTGKKYADVAPIVDGTTLHMQINMEITWQ